MTVGDAFKKFHRVEIELFLSHLLGKSKEFLFANPDFELTAKQSNNLIHFTRRRLKGEPVAYILGRKDFCGLSFKVNRQVLIPRPETEWLVDKIKNQIFKITNRKLKILDMGTGSGCIIVSLAHELKTKDLKSKADFVASDISSAALRVAKQNAKVHKIKIKFIKSDLFDKISGQFDIVIANLPYVSLPDYQKLKPSLKYEPKLALCAGGKNWLIFKRFFYQLPEHCKAGSLVFLEIEPKSKNLLAKWASRALPKAKINFYRDFGGFWRYLQISC